MKASDFDYFLPRELIAQEPAKERTAARMMVLHRHDETREHKRVEDIVEYIRPTDLLVVNDTRVIPARIFGHREATGGRVELLFLEEMRPGRWRALMRASRRPRPGTAIILGSGEVRAEVLQVGEGGEVEVALHGKEDFRTFLEREGLPPLPPYIGRNYPNDTRLARDILRYQTVYARRPGAVAAPTAGLHFTRQLLERIAARGTRRVAVTLHVGPGTFRPVKSELVEEHHMEEERYEISEETAAAVNDVRARGGRIVAIGSTVVRTLESSVGGDGYLVPGHGRTKLFIYPPFDFRITDAMLTNFHLPRSTLLMMVSAFAGREFVLESYREAVERGYRFFSYGDCMLIL